MYKEVQEAQELIKDKSEEKKIQCIAENKRQL